MSISYLDGRRLRRAMVAACRHGQRFKGELNRINVFPVPDGDTGTNLALTLRAIADGLVDVRERRVDRVASAVAQSAILGARGNCGMMLSHFLLGFAAGLEERARVSTREFGVAFMSGAAALEAALEEPVEGTILTVIRDAAVAAQDGQGHDFASLMSDVEKEARRSVARTPDLLPVLAEAGVVDAGAMGFFRMVEGVVGLIEGGGADEAGGTLPEFEDEEGEASPVALAEYPHDHGNHRYCTEVLVRGTQLPDAEVVRAALREGAEELLVIRSGDVLKVHLHTDDPDAAVAYCGSLGTLVAHKAEDMWVQHEAVRAHGSGLVRRPVGILVDSASDLPEAVVRAHGIHLVPLLLIEGDEVRKDRIEISAAEFHARLGSKASLPTTSQPPPGSFVDAFSEAASEAEMIVAVLLGSTLSGTFGSAEAAVRLAPGVDVRLVDSKGASLLTGLLALKAAELAESGLQPEEIVAEVTRIRERSNILFTVRELNRLIASGRVSRFAGWLGGVLDLKPVLGLAPDGSVRAYGKARGGDRVRALILDRIESEIPAGTTRVRFGVVHVGAPELVAPLREDLRARFGEVEILESPATPVIATHLGIGAWGIAYMVED